MKSGFTSRLKYGVSAVAVAAMSMTAQGAYAQEAEEENNIEEIVVMGSRIIRKDLTSSSPVTVLDSQAITVAGVTRIEDLVNSLPQAFNSQNSTVANGSTGTATVDLRKLGSSRTLVLLNGRRLMAGDPTSPAADLNFIPSALVKQVVVLTGGASSVYGTDAVAGVVNFELDTDFEGVRTSAQYSFYQHNNRNEKMREINKVKGFDVPEGSITDGGTLNLSLAVGGSFADDRGHASMYVTYRSIKNIPKANRDYSNCALNAGSAGIRCGGSSTTPWGTFYRGFQTYYLKDSAGNILLKKDDAGNLLYQEDADGNFILDDAGLKQTIQLKDKDKTKALNKPYMVDPDTGAWRERTGEVFNYGPYNFYQRDDKTYTMGAFVNYNITDNVELYTELMFMDDRTQAQIAPSGNFYRTSTINCDNPLLSAEQVQWICTDRGKAGSDDATLEFGRRNFEGGARNSDLRHTSFRILAGLRGEINDAWSYDAYGMMGQNVFEEAYTNDLNTRRIKRSLSVVMHDGKPTCKSVVDGTHPNCVPWNVFAKDGVTQEAIDYISGVGIAKGQTQTKMFSASVTGSLEEYGIQLPGADEGISVAFGVEYREESSEFNPDEAFQFGLLAGQGGATMAVSGEFNVKEIFGEVVVPIVQNAEFAQELSLELGYRYSDYSTAGGNSTFKVGLNWSPVEDITFRAGFNRAVRAPNIVNLYSPQRMGLGGGEDICSGDIKDGKVQGFTLEECARTGVTASQFGSIVENEAGQYNTRGGGNPLLKSERANTFTAGFVFTPSFLEGFALTVDWYNIKITDAISALGADDIITTCAKTGDAKLCSYIHRGTGGTLWRNDSGYTDTFSDNIGTLHASGVDVGITYNYDLEDHGNLSFKLTGTYLLKDEWETPVTAYDCVGLFGNQCGAPSSKWRHLARMTWQTNFDLDVSLGWRFTGGVMHDDLSTDIDIASPGNVDKLKANNIDKISGRSFIDLTFSYAVTDDMNVTVGVNNIFDKEPPLFPSLSSTAFRGTYDPLGRYIFLALRTNF